jgi:hypothetical protein
LVSESSESSPNEAVRVIGRFADNRSSRDIMGGCAEH